MGGWDVPGAAPVDVEDSSNHVDRRDTNEEVTGRVVLGILGVLCLLKRMGGWVGG